MGIIQDIRLRNQYVLVEDVHKYDWRAGDLFAETVMGNIYYCRTNLTPEQIESNRVLANKAHKELITYHMPQMLMTFDYELLFCVDAINLCLSTDLPTVQMRNIWLCAKKHLFLTTDRLPGVIELTKGNDE